MDLWCCQKLTNMAEQIVGPDVATHPVWNLRVKPPQNEFNPVPWHQGITPNSVGHGHYNKIPTLQTDCPFPME